MTGKQRRVDVIAQAFADRIFRELHAHTKVHAGFWLEAVVSEMFPGESVELYGPKLPSADRLQRQARIEAAVEAGESADAIARREGVTDRTVRTVRRRLRGKITP